MKILAIFVFCLTSLRFAADNFYQIAFRSLLAKRSYNTARFIEAASVLNPSSILIAQAERNVVPGATPAKRILFFHPEDFDALIMRTDELRIEGKNKEARKFLFRAAKADPYSSVLKEEMSALLKL